MRGRKREIQKDLQTKVVQLAAYGLTVEQISCIVEIPLRTLQRLYAKEIQEGIAKAALKVTQTAYQMATSGTNPAMTMFWLKCRCRWRETGDLAEAKDLPPIKIEIKQV